MTGRWKMAAVQAHRQSIVESVAEDVPEEPAPVVRIAALIPEKATTLRAHIARICEKHSVRIACRAMIRFAVSVLSYAAHPLKFV